MSSLAKEGVRAVKWSAVSTVARFVLQLVAQVVLARILGPENYGVFGIGMVVLTLSNFLSSFGFGWNLLHKKDLTTEDIRFAFTWQVVAGSTAMVTLYLSAPTLADYFREPRVLGVIQWLSLACLLSAAMAPSSNLLQRDLNFKAVGLIQVGSYAAGYLVVGIPMALAGLGVHSLVAAWLVQTGVALVASYTLRPHSLIPLFHFSGTGKAMGTSGQVFMTNVVNWCLNNVDRVLIGRMLNVHSVGVYTAGYNLATMPNNLLLSALQPAFMSAAARMQDEPKRLARVYMEMLATVWVLVLPFFVFLAAVASDVVHLLYGAKWAETAGVLAILFLGMPAYVTWGITTPVLWNTGRKHHEALLQLPVLLIGALSLYFATDWGVLAAAAVASGILVLRMIVVMGSAFVALRLDFYDVLPNVFRGLLLSVIPLLISTLFDFLFVSVDWIILRLMATSLLTLVVILSLVYKWPKLLGDAVLLMLTRFFPKLERYLSNGKAE
ncbi:MAG: lipopolysaccharide biosynthesis protein [Betaproteobacteria bacterium]|nr:lipopolysaccharide biosynthesis protein [Betaproteobacteria bacterium]